MPFCDRVNATNQGGSNVDEELVEDLLRTANAYSDLKCTGGENRLADRIREAVAEIRRLDVVIKEGERRVHNEMYGRSSSSITVPGSQDRS